MIYARKIHGRPKKARPLPLPSEQLTRGSIMLMGLVTVFVLLYLGAAFFIPVIAAFILGFLFTPILRWLQNRGLSPYLAAFLIFIAVLIATAIAFTSFAIPLSDWSTRIPLIIQKLSEHMTSLKSAFGNLEDISEQMRDITSDEEGSMKVEMENFSLIGWAAFSLPIFLGQLVLFFGTFFFFLAGRDQLYRNLMYLCVRRTAKLRTARILVDIEQVLTDYLVSITIINIGLGIAVGLMSYAFGLPNPVLWGVMACSFNYAPYLGPITMTGIFLFVGLGTFEQIDQAVLPALVYFTINAVEANFVTPSVLGARMTINPLTVFLSVAFWLWLWGPAGALMAMPMMLIVRSVIVRLIGLQPSSLANLSEMARTRAAKRTPEEAPAPAE